MEMLSAFISGIFGLFMGLNFPGTDFPVFYLFAAVFLLSVAVICFHILMGGNK